MKEKNYFPIICTILLVTIFTFTGCTKKVTTDNTNNNKPSGTETTTSKMNDIEKRAKEDVKNTENVTKEKIDEAVTYIHDHKEDSFTDNEVTEKMAYYGAYLKHAGNKAVDGSRHELAKLGDNVHSYIRNVYTKVEEKGSDVSTGLKDGIDKSITVINNAKEDMIEGFHKLIK